VGMVGDGDGDEMSRGWLGMELRLAGTVGDGDHCSSPCSSLGRTTGLFITHCNQPSTAADCAVCKPENSNTCVRWCFGDLNHFGMQATAKEYQRFAIRVA
jgi:hypothetical protein